MYHITDFEVAFESDKEEDTLVESPQQQCLPVEDVDDLDTSMMTTDGRRYLRSVRQEAAQYRVIRSSTAIASDGEQQQQQQSGTRASKATSSTTMHPTAALFGHPLWHSKALIGGVMHNFKYTRKLIKLHRAQVCNARNDFEVHFDLARAVRTRQWWLEYCFGSSTKPHSSGDYPWETAEDGGGAGGGGASSAMCPRENHKDGGAGNSDDDEEDEDDDEDNEEAANETEQLDYAWDKLALGEAMLASLHLCPPKEKTALANAYANGHQPQISFLCELDQTEVIRVLRFFRIWLRRDGYRPQLGLWLFGLLALLDPVQTGAVYHELRVLFLSCNQARMRTLLTVAAIKAAKDKSQMNLVPSSCNALLASEDDSTPASSSTKHCATCEQVRHLRKQHSTLCLVMLIIGHFFGQKDLIGALECDLTGLKQEATAMHY